MALWTTTQKPYIMTAWDEILHLEARLNLNTYSITPIDMPCGTGPFSAYVFVDMLQGLQGLMYL